ncbi:neprilysin-2-like protein, partial [Leptotrombidium deliense]
MDLSADPCDDFFLYACGNWNKKHLIPEDRSSISTFEVLSDELQILLKELLEEPNTGYDSSATVKARTLYKSCMKLDKIEEVGIQPLLRIIDGLGGWPVVNKSWHVPIMNVEILLGRVRGDHNLGFIIEQYVNVDDRNSTNHILQMDQPLLTLPSREYYLKPNSKKDRDAYFKYMIEVAVILGADREYAEKEMADVLQFETMLANVSKFYAKKFVKPLSNSVNLSQHELHFYNDVFYNLFALPQASMPEADRHDTGAIYNKMTIRELQAEVPEFNFLMYLNTYLPMEVSESEFIVVYAVDYLKSIGKLLRHTERKIIHNYVIWRVVNFFIPYMSSHFSVARTNFRKVLLGVTAERTRWVQCVEVLNKRLGMAVGAMFIKKHFDPKSKETALEMIHNIRDAFNELLDENEWMDEDTKTVAKQKANSMNERIGYPEILTNDIDVSKEFHSLHVYEDQFLFSILNILKFESTKNLQKLREPVNKDRWNTDPAVVNAFYNPNKNDIVFPAGILQPLFYSQRFPKSLNYGGIGVVIGHEITHGFDDKGRQFDKDGNLKQWWNNETIERFRDRTQCMIDQYSSFVLEDVGLNINGKMTQGENIADNGGLKQAYRAFIKWEAKHGVEPLLPGLTLDHHQLFFLNYAQIWCGSMRYQEAINKIRTSVHSPGPIRVRGPLSNSHDFSRAFNCPIGSRMNPIKKCSVW